MNLWVGLVAAIGALIWLLITDRIRRMASARAVSLATASDTLLHYYDAGVQGATLEEVVMHASDCARALMNIDSVVLIYLSEDRSSCRVVSQGLMSVDLSIEDWSMFVQAPWRQAGVLDRDTLQALGASDSSAARLDSLAGSLRVVQFIPGVLRGSLVCVLGVGVSTAPSVGPGGMLRLWVASFLPTFIQRITTGYAAQQEVLAREVEQASAMTAALASEAHQGVAGFLEWIVHENPDDRLGGGFWNAYRLSDDRLFVIAGEIVASDLAATMLSVAIRSLCDSLFAMRGDAVEPGQLLSDLNRFIWRERNPIGISCLAALYDPERSRAHYAVAGQMSMVRLRVVGNMAFTDALPGEGPLVGDRPHTEYTPNISDMGPDDVFFILSEAMGDIWRASPSDTAVHLRLRIENASTRPLDELRVALLETLGDFNRRRGSTPVVVVRERTVY